MRRWQHCTGTRYGLGVPAFRRTRGPAGRGLFTLLVLVATLTTAPVARAYGDPASDLLSDLDQTVYLSHATRTPIRDVTRLRAAVQAAGTHGFPIRVAIIASRYDLGSETVYWLKPAQYAKTLATEITQLEPRITGPLLVVMPNGMGFVYANHPTASARSLLERIPVASSPGKLTSAATTAVGRLEAAYGNPAAATTRTTAAAAPSSGRNRDRFVIVGAVAAAIAAGAVARLILRRLRAA